VGSNVLNSLKTFKRRLNAIGIGMMQRLGLTSQRPVIVVPYRGYGSNKKICIRGRVLKDRSIITSLYDSRWKTFINNYKRFGSREVSHAQLNITTESHQFDLSTDIEGYYHLNTPLHPPLISQSSKWYPIQINIQCIPGREINKQFSSEFLLPSAHAQFGIISDIDDTILKTDVTSILKLKLLYYTLLENAAGRKSFNEASTFYKKLEYGTADLPYNPVFYVSNSPWNLYDTIEEFLHLNHLPKGPILLRDFGMPYEEKPKDYPGHKHYSILQILDTYPELPFVLIGDSGEKDPYIYQSVASSRPNRIKAIYIRDVRSKRRLKKLSSFIEATQSDMFLFKSFDQALIDAQSRGLMKTSSK
jgi:phosphatidate phosphatase APP1